MTVEEAKEIMKKRKECGKRDHSGYCLSRAIYCDGCDVFVTDDQIEEAADIIIATFEERKK